MKNNSLPSVGSVITAHFDDTTLLSSGVSKIDGAVVFTSGMLEGDTAEIEIVKNEKNYSIARCRSIISPSCHRVAPLCSANDQCGGCSFSHADYEYEKELKRRAITAAFRRCSLGDIPVSETLSAAHERYRNKAVLHFDKSGKLGYYSRSTHSSAFPEDFDCLLHPIFYKDVIAFANLFFSRREQKPTYIYLRSSEAYDSFILTVGTSDGRPTEDICRFASEAKTSFPSLIGVFIGHGDSPEDGEIKPLLGDTSLRDRFCSLEMSISPSAFYQVNHEAAELLAKTVLEYADVRKGECIADMYCGTGIFGMAIAKSAPEAKVIGVEINESAVKNAKENAKLNELHNIEFFCGDSADFATFFKGKISCAVIDPPRSGCSRETVDELVRLAPERIVYVSCNPATLARDLSLLTSCGYTAKKATPVDMFPRTSHVETVALLTRDGAKNIPDRSAK